MTPSYGKVLISKYIAPFVISKIIDSLEDVYAISINSCISLETMVKNCDNIPSQN